MKADRFISLLLLYAMGQGTAALAQDQAGSNSNCGTLYSQGQYGPFDFRTDKDKLPIVLGAHFQPYVESLIRGNTASRPGGDIDYTLRAIPNHPNALLSMIRLGDKEKTQQPSGSRYTVECWLDRAMRFRPDDQVVRMIFVTFLTQNNRKADAMQQLEIVLGNAKDNAFTHNNIGLLYFDLGEYQKALAQAQKSIELGLNWPALSDKLKAAGKWQEPSAGNSPAEPPEPSAAASAPLKP